MVVRSAVEICKKFSLSHLFLCQNLSMISIIDKSSNIFTNHYEWLKSFRFFFNVEKWNENIVTNRRE